MLLEAAIPTRVRKIFFLTTIYMQVHRLPAHHDELLQPLYKQMRLAQFKNALMLPAMFSNLIWKDTTLQTFLLELQTSADKEEVKDALHRQIALSIVNITPRWLYYGRRDDMLNNVVEMLSLSDKEIPQAA
jgi:hypothetical protein